MMASFTAVLMFALSVFFGSLTGYLACQTQEIGKNNDKGGVLALLFTILFFAIGVVLLSLR